MLHVAPRYSGPIGYANGGWIAGMVAQASGLDPAQVTLRKPIPLDVDLTLSDGRLMHGEDLIVEVTQGEFTRPIPTAVSVDDAIDAQTRTLVRASPDYGNCLVCGVDRPDGYALRPGAVAGLDDTVACLWRPSALTPSLPDADAIPAAWAAMDCPGVWTIDAPREPMLLGRMTATVLHAPDLRDDVVVVGRLDAREGRKMLTSTALFAPDGTLLAHSEQVWIAVAAHPSAA